MESDVKQYIDSQIQREIAKLKTRIIHPHEITSNLIKQRHIEDAVIRIGSGNRPDDGTTGTKAHFDTSTGVLSIWDGTQWLECTLS